MSYAVQGMLQRFGIRHNHTTPYHLQTNGHLEKFINILTQILTQMTAPQKQTSWDQLLLDALLAHRAHASSSTGVSPFFLMYRREVCLTSQRSSEVTERNPIDEEIEQLREK